MILNAYKPEKKTYGHSLYAKYFRAVCISPYDKPFFFYVLFVGLEHLNYISLWQVAAPASAEASTCPDTEVQLQG